MGSIPTRRISSIGRRAEQAVEQYLLQRGYRILDRNLRLGHLELDIVAQKGSLIAIVEVRHRGPTSFQSAFESIDPPKQQRLFRAAEQLWEQRFATDPSIERIRLDIASVSFGPHLETVDYIEGGLD
ncbi:MAG TPA: YraN family protein [Polyangiaceae bacterium]|jgi:putative endonuclease|nr:MAG: hypothetical protein BWY17_01062 [Deltaproteobacteria bacterium ADurb.Bin207]HNS97879.1 YraN family protein [Polyangiaceae bacterium]HNZ22536.1 YraN family protein [Polyangiaceae bacterium]HOD25293.1 YraN family protein [Polyangiaceae bacterium]HOE48542.1 YraN family protein [Polyangiaceae bacterium]